MKPPQPPSSRRSRRSSAKSATAAEKQRALAEARQAIEQQNLQAASTREGLYKLSEKLRGNRALEDVAEALEEGDAARAARLMQKMAEARGAAKTQEPGAAVGAREQEKDLERLLKDAAQGEEQGSAARDFQRRSQGSGRSAEPDCRAARAAGAVERSGAGVEPAAARGRPALPLVGRTLQSAGGAECDAVPDSGQTSMPGGTMYRAAAVAQENKASQQQEGSKSGAALGDSQADPVLGKKVTPLAVQLKQEAVAGESQDEAAGCPRAGSTPKARSRSRCSTTRAWAHASSFALGQSTGPEGISINHRQIVKDYFMTLREGSQR